MTAASAPSASIAVPRRRPGWHRLRADRLGFVALWVVLSCGLLVVAVSAGLLAADWQRDVAPGHAPPSWWPAAADAVGGDSRRGTGAVGRHGDSGDGEVSGSGSGSGSDRGGSGSTRGTSVDGEPTVVETIVDPLADAIAQSRASIAASPAVAGPTASSHRWLALGTDRWGRDVLAKTLQGARTSILIGLTAAAVATLIGTLLGALAGWFGGRADDAANALYNVFTALPPVLLILAIAAVLAQRSLLSVVAILALTSWTGVFRVMRAEFLRHASRDYVRAAEAIGASVSRRLWVHILPNVAGTIAVQFTLLTVGCIKYEVILSYLGFGVPVDGVSWGTMLIEAQNDLLTGRWWQLAAAAAAMALFVTALSLLGDALRDASDPRSARAARDAR